MSSVAGHYGLPDLLSTILNALEAQGKSLDNLTADDLAAIDEFHIRGREATVELAEMSEVRNNSKVLDVGSGLGGSTRFLAAEFGCRIVGVDITPEYCETAQALSKLVGLEQLTEFHCASALEMPFEDATFDLAWTQHVQMNIADKPGFYREIARVLRPGGRFAFHDILAGPGGPPHFPVHWAGVPEMSFLIAPHDLLALLERSGFRVLTWRDTTAISREWFLAALQRRQESGAPPLGLHLLLGDTAADKFANVGRNLSEDRITVFQGVLEKTG
ncbi:MAG: methyltransferase domain-containing protein [Acidobacteria bacterium]|nr:methyltransferase domain-containing protein [Acidobacteriota bacterium]